MLEDHLEDGAPVPGPLELVLEADFVVAHQSALRLLRIDELRRAHLSDAAVAGRRLTDVVMRGLRLELAAAMRVTEHAAGSLIALAEALTQRFPDVMDALWEARITERHAEILVESLDELEPDLRAQACERGLTLAVAQPVGAFRREMKKLIESMRVVTLAARHEAALAQRRVFVEPVADGMAWTHLYGPTVEAHAAYGRATAIAKTILTQEGETRTLDQARADVMADLLIEGQMAEHPGEARGIRATVVVTVPALALLEDNDDSVAAAGMDPASVEGVGPIPIARAKELCGADPGWMRVLTHPETGMILSVGRDQYSPPASLKRLVKWRAERCMTPGCGMPASRCEVDHNLAWSDGGETSLQNNAPFCKGHHLVKHHGGWRIRQIPDSGGAIEWTSPAGRVYLVQPERRVPVFTSAHSGGSLRGHRDAPRAHGDDGIPPF